MLTRLLTGQSRPDEIDLDPGINDPMQLLGNTLHSLDTEQIIELLDTMLAELPDTPMDEQLLVTVLAGQLAISGQEGADALWDFIERAADTIALPLLLFPLVSSSQERTRVRRLLYGLLADDDPERVVAGISGFYMRRDRKALSRVLPLRQHPSPIVRAEVLAYYCAVSPADSLPWLLEAKEDPAPEVRRAAANCVLELSCAPVVDDVRQAFQRLRGRKLRDAASAYLDGSIFEPDELTFVVQDALDAFAWSEREIRWKDIQQEERAESNGVAPLESYVMLAMRDGDDPRLAQRLHELWTSGDTWQRHIALTAMTVSGDRTFEEEILAARDIRDEFLTPAAYMYQRMFDPVGAIPDLLELLKSDQWANQMFAIVTLGGTFASEVDTLIRVWCEEMTGDPDEAVQKLAHAALTPEWERRFGNLNLPLIGPHWSYAPSA